MRLVVFFLIICSIGGIFGGLCGYFLPEPLGQITAMVFGVIWGIVSATYSLEKGWIEF